MNVQYHYFFDLLIYGSVSFLTSFYAITSTHSNEYPEMYKIPTTNILWILFGIFFFKYIHKNIKLYIKIQNLFIKVDFYTFMKY